jgi:hypothetical protein
MPWYVWLGIAVILGAAYLLRPRLVGSRAWAIHAVTCMSLAMFVGMTATTLTDWDVRIPGSWRTLLALPAIFALVYPFHIAALWSAWPENRRHASSVTAASALGVTAALAVVFAVNLELRVRTLEEDRQKAGEIAGSVSRGMSREDVLERLEQDRLRSRIGSDLGDRILAGPIVFELDETGEVTNARQSWAEDHYDALQRMVGDAERNTPGEVTASN